MKQNITVESNAKMDKTEMTDQKSSNARQMRVLHIMAGSENWTPTGEDLYHLVECFDNACTFVSKELSADEAVKHCISAIATNSDISVKVLEFNSNGPDLIVADPKLKLQATVTRLLSELMLEGADAPDAENHSLEYNLGYQASQLALRKRVEDLVVEIVNKYQDED